MDLNSIKHNGSLLLSLKFSLGLLSGSVFYTACVFFMFNGVSKAKDTVTCISF